MAWTSIAACVLLALGLAGGQILFKYAATDISERLTRSWLIAGLSPWLWGALILYLATTILWIAILMREPLSKAYPFALVGAALVPVFAWILFDERLTLTYWIGMAAVLAGIMLTQLR